MQPTRKGTHASLRPKVVLQIIFLGTATQTATVIAQPRGTFAATGNMTTPRVGHTATLLPSGKVLIAGGVAGSYYRIDLASAELYDPATGTFTATGNMTTPRLVHTATLLPSGKVLIAGGGFFGVDPDSGLHYLASAELYDPATGTFTATGNMTTPRLVHTATLLDSGKVLMTGGYNNGAERPPGPGVGVQSFLASAELYDPSTGTFTSTGDMTTARYEHTATLLADGRVLIANGRKEFVPYVGNAVDSNEVYDPDTGTFSLTGATADEGVPYLLTSAIASLLTNGKVLLTLHCPNDDPCDTDLAELYDPSSGAFNATGKMTWTRENNNTATLLADGKVLIAGNVYDNTDRRLDGLDLAELYDSTRGTFSPVGPMTTDRAWHTATLLRDGTVLMAGGAEYRTTGSLASAELYHPAALVPAPELFSVSGDGRGQGAFWHAGTRRIASADDPAVPGEALTFYTTSLVDGGVIPPQVAIGGRMAEVVSFGNGGNAPEFAGQNQVTIRVPGGIAGGSAVPVRLTYLGRPSNEVTIGIGEL